MNSYQPIRLGGNANNDERVNKQANSFKEFFILIKAKEELL